MTQGDDYVVDENADDEEDQRHVMSDDQNSIKVGRAQRNQHEPSRLTTYIIVAYALSIIKEASRLHIGKLKSVQSLRCGRMP